MTWLKQNLKRLYSGRLNRKNLFISMVFLLVLLLTMIFILDPFWRTGGILDGNILLNIFLGIFLTLFYIVYFSMFARRAHDFGWSAWGALLIFVPFGILYLLFKKGNDKLNKYGDISENKFKYFKTVLNK